MHAVLHENSSKNQTNSHLPSFSISLLPLLQSTYSDIKMEFDFESITFRICIELGYEWFESMLFSCHQSSLSLVASIMSIHIWFYLQLICIIDVFFSIMIDHQFPGNRAQHKNRKKKHNPHIHDSACKTVIGFEDETKMKKKKKTEAFVWVFFYWSSVV